MGFSWDKMCLPAKINLALSAMHIISMIYVGYRAFSVLVSLLFVAFWTWILVTLCDNGYQTLSWILVVGPFVIGLLIFALALESVASYNFHRRKKDLNIY